MISLVDDYGRTTRFHGTEVATYEAPTHDDVGRVKPQRTTMRVWRTRAGAYVVQRVVLYQTNHATQDCVRLVMEPRPAEPGDSFVCLKCGGGIWASHGKKDVWMYRTPQELIDSLRLGPRHGDMSQALLADISEHDAAVAALWMEQTVE